MLDVTDPRLSVPAKWMPLLRHGRERCPAGHLTRPAPFAYLITEPIAFLFPALGIILKHGTLALGRPHGPRGRPVARITS